MSHDMTDTRRQCRSNKLDPERRLRHDLLICGVDKVLNAF